MLFNNLSLAVFSALFFLILCSSSTPTSATYRPINSVKQLERRGIWPKAFYSWDIYNNYKNYLAGLSKPTPSLQQFPRGESVGSKGQEVYAFSPDLYDTLSPPCQMWTVEIFDDEIASGGYGDILDGEMQRAEGKSETVAVKKTTKDALGMLRGDRLRQKMSGSGVLQTYGSFWMKRRQEADSGPAFSVLPLIKGGDLSKWINNLGKKSRTMSQSDFWAEVDQTFEGLLKIADSISKADIAHRDIKPENFMLDGQQWKVIDFDMATSATPSEKSTDYSLGSLLYTPY